MEVPAPHLLPTLLRCPGVCSPWALSLASPWCPLTAPRARLGLAWHRSALGPCAPGRLPPPPYPEPVSQLTERLRDAENESMAKIAELEKQLSQARKELETLRVRSGKREQWGGGGARRRGKGEGERGERKGLVPSGVDPLRHRSVWERRIPRAVRCGPLQTRPRPQRGPRRWS